MNRDFEKREYDVIVVGGGHAGIEAALAASGMGAKTLLLTINLDTIGWMSCNPSIGGSAKGQLVREIDALGGWMGKLTDETHIQIRLLNESKGPAVHALRAQADKKRYAYFAQRTLENAENLHVKQAMVDGLLVQGDKIRGVQTGTGFKFFAKTVVLTTGTFLGGRIITGDHIIEGGRLGEHAAIKLSGSLRDLGFDLGRLKTGTPPRLDARTIDYSLAEPQFGSETPLHFSFDSSAEGYPAWLNEPPHPAYLTSEKTNWRPQIACHLIYTEPQTHEVIRLNLDRAPLFSGIVEGVGPRYCPSIEDKIVRFADKDRHQLFLEPEGWRTTEVYLQGFNTSMPEDTQWEMIRSMPALRNAEIIRLGYAIEYDYVPPHQLHPWLETKRIEGLFHAGQINGTTGYEEAAAQGLMAGINAVLKIQEKAPFILRRDQAYIGVLIDDLVTMEHTEPYRQMTSRAEHRLLLRHDNADLRLTAFGHELGLIGADRFSRVETHRRQIATELARLEKTNLSPKNGSTEILAKYGIAPIIHGVNAKKFLRRPEVTYDILAQLSPPPETLPEAVTHQVTIETKFEGYLAKQQGQVERMRRLDTRPIPADFDFSAVSGLRLEAREKLIKFQPATVGQASRIAGVNPADISILLVHLERDALQTKA